MTKREVEQQRRDLETGQRAFAALPVGDRTTIIDALHAEQIEKDVSSIDFEWSYTLQRFEEEGQKAGEVIGRWKERISRAPEHVHHELEWADSLFEAAAVAWVNHEVVMVLRSGGPERAKRWLTDRLIAVARPGSSSSHSHNLMGYAEARALGSALEWLKW